MNVKSNVPVANPATDTDLNDKTGNYSVWNLREWLGFPCQCVSVRENYSGFLSQSFIFQYDHDNDVKVIYFLVKLSLIVLVWDFLSLLLHPKKM